MSEGNLSWDSLRTALRQNHQQGVEAIYELLPKDTKDALSLQSVRIIFGHESPQALRRGARGVASQTVRERGNAAAHQLNLEDVVCAVLQGDLTEGERSSLGQVYSFVFGQHPSFDE